MFKSQLNYNSFAGNLNIYSAGHKQVPRTPRPYKNLWQFLCVLYAWNTTNTLKSNLTDNFTEEIKMYF